MECVTRRGVLSGAVLWAMVACASMGQASPGGAQQDAQSNTKETAPVVPSLVALVLAVEGRAQVRIDASEEIESEDAAPVSWQAIDRGMELPEGATIRTGARASVTLRVGLNSTVRVNSFSRARIGELTQDNADHSSGSQRTLRTTLVLERGDLDVRVDHIDGAANDFAIVTQTATLAVRGTNFSVGVDSLEGLRVQGAETNSFRAIEVQYMADEAKTALSHGQLGGAWRHPALAALAGTFDTPNLGVQATDYLVRIGMPVSQLVSAPVSGEHIAGGREGEVRIVNAGQINESIGKGKNGPPPQGETISKR